MNTPRLIWFLLGWLLPLSLWAQQSGGCGCDRIKPTTGRGFGTITEPEAQTLIEALQTPFTRRLFITAKPFVCPGYAASSEICPTNHQDRYIFYSESLISRLRNGASQGDAFVLAHELAHHLLGHTVEGFMMSGQTGAKEAVRIPAQSFSYTTVSSNQRSQTQAVFLSHQHLLELEADALALWLVSKQQRVTQSSMNAIFAMLPTIINKAASATHPSLALRKQVIDQQLARLKDPDYLKKYLAIYNQASREAGVYDPTNPLHNDVEAAYGFALVTTDSALTGLELERRDSLVHRHRFTFGLVVGGQYQRPALSRNGNPVTATDSRGGVAGVRLSVGPWYRRHQLETDLLMSWSTFTTQLLQADGLQTAEKFTTTSLVLRPRYVYTLHRTDAYAQQQSHSWLLTGGLAMGIPLTFTYAINGVTPYVAPVAKSSLWPLVGVGYGCDNWRRGHVRLWLLYQPQLLRYETAAPDPIHATLQTFSLEASIQPWR